MDSEIRDKINVTVTDILKSSGIDSITEKQVRDLTSQKLGIDLSDLPYKIHVRQIVESFLLSLDDSAVEEQDVKPVVNVKDKGKEIAKPPDSCRVICKLSQKKEVAVRICEGKKVVTLGEPSGNDEKIVPTRTCISLFPDQWSILRKNIPAIEEAIIKVESRLRSRIEDKQPNDKFGSKQNGGGGSSGAELVHKKPANNRSRHAATKEQAEVASTVVSTPQRFVPIEVIRFDGTNYQQWAERMEPYLNQLKVAYVLSEPCPSAIGVADRDLPQILSAAEKWMDDNYFCRQNILNSLCDNLLGYYSKKPGTAKDLWEDLKVIYLHEEYGANMSLVKKYIEFEIVEGKSVFEQVHEFNQIADALNASGMHVEEKFHVNAIISKLPPSWKPSSIELMKEENLPVWMLMNHLKAKEESGRKGNKGETLVPRVDLPEFQQFKKPGLHRFPMKKMGYPHAPYEVDRDKKFKFCSICKKKGHVPEQCWFRKPGEKDTTNEKDKGTSVNRADTEDAARHIP